MIPNTMTTPALVVVGSNHEYAPVSVRERLAFAGDALTDGLRALNTHVGEGLILSTCNRTEIYVVSDDEDRAREGIFDFLETYHSVPVSVLERASYVFSGNDAVDHLFRVASGLDSLVLGEPQILSQIRDALDVARDAASVGPLLQRLATDALRVGKRARTETDIARNRVSIAHAAVELAQHELGDLAGRSAVVLGAGKMATLAAKLLAGAGVGSLTIVNRTLPKAFELAEATGGQGMPLTGLQHAIARADLVVGAALSDHPLIDAEMVAGRETPLLAIDLSVPRVIDAACEAVPMVSVRDVDALETVVERTRQQYAGEVRKVEVLVSDAVDAFGEWTRSRAAVEAIMAIRAKADAIRDAELERTLRKLSHLNERDRNLVRAMAGGITNKLLHQPVQALRAATSEDDVAGALHLFGLDTDA
ncbi:MAG: glutamyl-tRNA reductase [Thermomicrobiales bacterium]